MPVRIDKDINGYFVRWGNSGKKYYFDNNNIKDYKKAYNKAIAQSRAIYSSGYKIT